MRNASLSVPLEGNIVVVQIENLAQLVSSAKECYTFEDKHSNIPVYVWYAMLHISFLQRYLYFWCLSMPTLHFKIAQTGAVCIWWHFDLVRHPLWQLLL